MPLTVGGRVNSPDATSPYNAFPGSVADVSPLRGATTAMPMTPPPDDPVAVQLIAALNDPGVPEGDQPDAAMDLYEHSGPWLEQAVFEILRREDFRSVLAQLCAESLAEIWAREGRVDEAFFPELRGRPWTRCSASLDRVHRT
ncbi:hypothetical protein ABZ478_27455 [Streptomyces sp. NPDC005706]|uniref:hypothetical protein n=1 Tax=Streptomyces sp. NPDC005706 TaxID=3157169 RepID=UPI00340EB514